MFQLKTSRISKLEELLGKAGISIYRPYVGNYFTSLEMRGITVTLMKLDAELEELISAEATSIGTHPGQAFLKPHQKEMDASYPTSEGRKLLLALIETVDTHGAYLSEIDGATGDGDHGINMTKGVRRTKEKLGEQNVTVPQGLDMLGQVLLAEIGGAMGPLYGSFFIDMGTACGDSPAIDREVFGKMLKAGAAAMQDLGGAKVGDKTMMDGPDPGG